MNEQADRDSTKYISTAEIAKQMFLAKFGKVPESVPEDTSCPPFNWQEKFQSLTIFHGVDRVKSFKETNYFFAPCRKACKFKGKKKITPYMILDRINEQNCDCIKCIENPAENGGWNGGYRIRTSLDVLVDIGHNNCPCPFVMDMLDPGEAPTE